MCFSAITIYNPPDFHPILKASEGKDVPLKYAKTEAIAKAKHLAEWNAKHRPSSFSGCPIFPYPIWPCLHWSRVHRCT